MPQKLLWSAARDVALLRLRRGGTSWDGIGTVLRVSRNAAIERGRRLGARLPPRVATAGLAVEDPDRPPLPAGHLVTWGALVGGTVLADEPYPPPAALGSGRSVSRNG